MLNFKSDPWGESSNIFQCEMVAAQETKFDNYAWTNVEVGFPFPQCYLSFLFMYSLISLIRLGCYSDISHQRGCSQPIRRLDLPLFQPPCQSTRGLLIKNFTDRYS